MIPLQLTLKNFLSYREATLDFRGLHVACICGANGAGKSSLLEAIAWVLWGQSRASSDDDVIHQGTAEARVDFTFQCHQRTFRVIRTRLRGQSSQLEFQAQTSDGFRSLTAKGMRATQQMIVQSLRLDYDTFINSAYLRQGRANEFMLKRPGERKQVLADLLQLDQYDRLADGAKERSRQFKAELQVLNNSLQNLESQLHQQEQLDAEKADLNAQLETLQAQHTETQAEVQRCQEIRQWRQGWMQQQELLQTQRQRLVDDGQRLQQEQETLEAQRQEYETILAESEAIAQGFAQYQSLQSAEEAESQKFQRHQEALARRQPLQDALAQETATCQDTLQRVTIQLETLHQQIEEQTHLLRKSDDIGEALERLQAARDRLSYYDRLQAEVAPLLQRRQQIQSELDRAQARLSARLEELQTHTQTLSQREQQQPQLQQAVLAITQQLDYLEKRKHYQQQVREKGVERRSFLERLQQRQRDYEARFGELGQKIAWLEQNSGRGLSQIGQRALQPVLRSAAEAESSYGTKDEGFPPCPLCDRPLDAHHWELVLSRYRAEQKEIQDQLWVLREQLATSDREIQLLRQEYRELEQELAPYAQILQRQGQLQAQMQGVVADQSRLQQLRQEQITLERTLTHGHIAPDLQAELASLDRTLQELNYDDKDHALARGEVDRWRWAEIRQAELKQAVKRRSHLMERLPNLEQQRVDLERKLAECAASPLQQQIDAIEAELKAIAYEPTHHASLRQALRDAQVWQWRQQELHRAQQHYPQVQERLQALAHQQQTQQDALQSIDQQLQTLTQHLNDHPDPGNRLQALEQHCQQQRQTLDASLAQLGRIEQQQQHLERLREQQTEWQQQQQTLHHQIRVYQELAQAFGKNGIQALMIENVLPQLEAEANHILGRLSNHQLHVQFVTQRQRRNNRKSTALIDTLDILISDSQGTRSYETYSGGETFRINFAIRLALARLLAQRSGMALQLLIVDEGFGTQDDVGCDRLIASIQAIADDFACILTVTHIPRLKEAFQTRIEVEKTTEGSKLSLVV